MYTTRKQLTTAINKAICGAAKGIFSDQGWRGHQLVMTALTSVPGIELTEGKAEYQHDATGTPNGKRWLYTVSDGKREASVVIVAAGAGSVKDPLEKYDIVAYAS